VHFLPILTRIVSTLENNPKAYNLPRTNRPRIDPPILSNATSGNIKQDYIWQRIGRFLREGDIILAESGTAQFGMPDATFPQDAKWITQIFWSSIGYTVGASLGACVAAKELQRNGNGEKSNASGGKGRVILIVGEGSLQMTVQEIGTLIRFGFTPIIFVINNSGYSIERAINGPEQEYNDVSDLWDYQGMLKFFGARQERSFRCETVEELEVVLGEKQFSKAEVIQVCEVVMGKFDYPWRLNEQLVIARARMKAMKETNRSA
jgi:pyruvate decarboxylase